MKIKYILTLFLIAFCVAIKAQNQQTTSYILNWKGVEKWYLDSTTMKVISFEGAKYPNETLLPYFNQRIVSDPAFIYNVVLNNASYVPLTNEEIILLNGNKNFPVNADVNSTILHSKGISYLDINILPFVNRGGTLLKLQSFDLQTTKTQGARKISGQSSNSYALNSVLAQGKFVKIRIKDSGIFKLTYEDLVAMGVDPGNVRIFGYGGNVLEQNFAISKPDDLPELSIYMNKGSDGVFNAGDYILFYGQGINKWTYDKSKQMFTHTINPYSNYGYYFEIGRAHV